MMASRSTSCSSEASASGGKDPLVPAQAGTQGPHNERPCKSPWTPACTGMSGESAVQFEENMLSLSQDRVMTRAMRKTEELNDNRFGCVAPARRLHLRTCVRPTLPRHAARRSRAELSLEDDHGCDPVRARQCQRRGGAHRARPAAEAAWAADRDREPRR